MKDKIAELNKLIQDYPDMPVKIFVDNDQLCEDQGYTSHIIRSVEISGWYPIDEYIYVDEDELSERFEEDLGCTEEIAREMARENLIDVILIKTGV